MGCARQTKVRTPTHLENERCWDSWSCPNTTPPPPNVVVGQTNQQTPVGRDNARPVASNGKQTLLPHQPQLTREGNNHG